MVGVDIIAPSSVESTIVTDSSWSRHNEILLRKSHCVDET